MPRMETYTSPAEREHTRQTYYATSENAAGMEHLWHIQQLAAIRLSPSHTITGAPDVDFGTTGRTAEVDLVQSQARYTQRVHREEADIHEANTHLLRHLFCETDDHQRAARHLNLMPSPAEVARRETSAASARNWDRQFQLQNRQLVAENTRFFDHLVAVTPAVRTATELDDWYHHVHQKRLAQISRFKPAETYAGQRILRVTVPGTGLPNSGASPRVRGQPYPEPSFGETLHRSQGTMQSTGKSTCSRPKCGLAACAATATTGDQADVNGTVSSQQRRPWESISATDIRLLHSTTDALLRRGKVTTGRMGSPAATKSAWRSPPPTSLGRSDGGGRYTPPPARFVTTEEEGGVTQLWRQAVDKRHPTRSTSPVSDTPPRRSPPKSLRSPKSDWPGPTAFFSPADTAGSGRRATGNGTKNFAATAGPVRQKSLAEGRSAMSQTTPVAVKAAEKPPTMKEVAAADAADTVSRERGYTLPGTELPPVESALIEEGEEKEELSHPEKKEKECVREEASASSATVMLADPAEADMSKWTDATCTSATAVSGATDHVIPVPAHLLDYLLDAAGAAETGTQVRVPSLSHVSTSASLSASRTVEVKAMVTLKGMMNAWRREMQKSNRAFLPL